MSARRKRDLTRHQFEQRLLKLGWECQGYFGYWKGPSGLAVSELNYDRRRDALRNMQRLDTQHAKERAERIKALAERDPE